MSASLLLQSESMNSAAVNILSGKHALLVEDQTLIALDTEMLLLELGATAVDTFTTAESAIAWLASAAPDVGVLDISLGGAASSYPVADVLNQRAKPFVFTTGYDQTAIPQQYSGVPIVRKPYTREALGDALAASLGLGQASP